ncbi:M50 family metallopeptidase [Amycolatopsis thailandensis]|uniref:M50 family metallopeptidase n=1 Tax=Amycolatopsis thailandensis TaxID=589330 RepID=UPI0037B3E4E5
MAEGRFSDVITAVAPAPGGWLVALTGLVAVSVTGASFVFAATGRQHLLINFNVMGTVVHEAGHALVACLTGGGVYRFRITSPDSGSVDSWYFTRFSSIVTSMAGYAMPPLAGLGAAALLHKGQAAAVLTLTTAMSIVILWVARDLLTLACIVAIGAIAASTLYWAPAWLQVLVAYLEAWLLLFSELGGLAYLVANRVRGLASGADDADDLAQETSIPGLFWIAVWFALILWALWTAFPLLWP